MASSDTAMGRADTNGARSARLTDTNNEGDLPTTEEQKVPNDKRLNLRQWIVEKFNWTWFTCSQSTGGIGILLSESPKQFHGLQAIGTSYYERRGFVQAPECFFFGSFWLTIATIIISMDRFGAPHAGPWLTVAIRVCYWIYAAVTLASATAHFVTVFEFTPVTAVQMNPGSMILVYNTMLTGTIASSIAKGQPLAQRLPIVVSGIAFREFGW
ncbi:C4-dicarboxylate transporter/malic acid transport protein [Akanthomyces lecanii RCEF 1005]|uniref:C4-dicarboxylate transporter/malic acid transport protein n=1 Tax=Akanthomyces lecanii RCEF 1005 TaxID=1081108 RepID=A0A168FY02_CORDF|nr:C4-dicarboxylate transporter/malic acid transport protein [Akanthomyces lecanii RCEF 1005]